MKKSLSISVILAVMSFSTSAFAADKLTFYCSAQEDWCQLMTQEFSAATGIKVNMTRKSSGETFAQIKAESANPKGDVWWGGTGDPHLQAAEEGLTEPYVSPMRSELQDWALRQASSASDKTIGIYSGALGYGYNEELLKKNNLPVPSCWRICSNQSTKAMFKWRTQTLQALPIQLWLLWSRYLAKRKALNS